ncbi:MAG: heterodisulfide reductase-related iron-sulfur binding cluster [Planctomycetota bacterium]|jgi:Fe-S oxidoreductase/nitrate reductase gamma subunit
MYIARRVLLAALLMGCPAVPAVAAQAGDGWGSASSPSLDFRTNGNALPMYGLCVLCLGVFLFGVYRHVRSLGLPIGKQVGLRKVLRGLGRLFRFGLLHRRLLRRRYSASTHLLLFWGFVVLALGSLLIMVDTYVLESFGLRLPRGSGYRLFQFALDAFGLALLGGVALALYRRLWIRPAHTRPSGSMLFVLGVLLAMSLSGFIMEGLRMLIEESSESWSFVGTAVAGLLASVPVLEENGLLLYQGLWWAHAAVAFGLIAAVPYSPLRHALTSPLQILVGSERLSGKLSTPFRLADLLQSGSFDVKVGVQRAEDFSWRERLALAACAGSGGCQEVCPAHATGTTLSPMRLMEEMEGKRVNGATCLLDGSVAEDAIWSCTLCGACTDQCPVLVDPMSLVMQLRRGLASGNQLGKQRTRLLANLSYAGNAYGSNRSSAAGLAAELGVPTPIERSQVDVLYWVGCAGTFDPRIRDVAKATTALLEHAGLRCTVLGPEESCCGDPARRVGEEGLFQDLVARNLAVFEKHGVKRIVTHCAHCFNSFHNEYPEFGARLEVQHHTTLIHQLIASGRLRPVTHASETITLHDACYIGRFDGSVHAPRSILESIPGTTIREMQRSRRETRCCGAGGANYWYDVPRDEKMSVVRVREARETGADVLVTECPFCLKMLEDAGGASGDGSPMRVRDIAEVIAASVGDGEQES